MRGQKSISVNHPAHIYFLKKVKKEKIQAFTSFIYLKVILPHIKDNYKFYVGYGFSNENESYWIYTKEFNVNLNYDKEIRLYFEPLFKSFDVDFHFYQFIYGFNRNNYPEDLKVEEFEINELYSNIITSKDSKYFRLHNVFMFYKCKNEKLKFFFGHDFNNYFTEEVNKSLYFNFTNYVNDDFLEIEANEDFLLFKGRDFRKNNNISIYRYDEKFELNKSSIYVIFEQPDHYYAYIKYIFAPKTDYYIENLNNECFLYNLFESKNKDNNILITDYTDFRKIIKKKYKEYLVTVVVISYIEKNYYFYNVKTLKVSQKLIDQIEKGKGISIYIVCIIVGIMLICFITAYKNNKKADQNLDGNFEEVDNIDLI